MKNIIEILTLFVCFAILVGCNKAESIKPQKTDILDAVFASGYIIMENEYLVTANAESFVEQAFVKEGDSVTIGTPLFLLSSGVQTAQLSNAQLSYKDALRKSQPNSATIKQQELQIEQAKSQMELDKVNFERYANLIDKNAVSKIDFDKAKVQYENSKNNVAILQKNLEDLKFSLATSASNARNQLKIQKENTNDYSIESRIDGQVLNIYKKQGELVRKGEHLAKVGGGKSLVKLFVAEEDISKIKIGQKVAVNLNTLKGTDLTATINKIYPAFDDTEQSYIVEATFQNKPKTLFAGAQLQANIIVNLIEDALVIPSIYLKNGKVRTSKNTEVDVKVGIVNFDFVQILEGLTEDTELYLPN